MKRCRRSHASVWADGLLWGTPDLILTQRFYSKGRSRFSSVVTSRSRVIDIDCRCRPLLRASLISRISQCFSRSTLKPSRMASTPRLGGGGPSCWATTPHFVLISSSCEATSGEFYDGITEDGYGELGNPHEAYHYEEYRTRPTARRSWNQTTLQR